MKKVKVKDFWIGKGEPLTIVAGPCVIESEEIALKSAEFLSRAVRKTPFNLIYKSSYDKANRSSLTAFRGPGLEKGLRILEKVKKEFNLPVFTDVHTEEEARAAASVCDVLQIPAFLCRQTDFTLAVGRSGAVVNVKKGQFIAPWDVGNVVEKLLSTGNEKILLTERGTSFGYNNLVADFRSIPIMQRFGFPVLFDITHSVQLPGARGTESGGEREFIPMLARAALAVGCEGIFAEVHPHPASAKCDSATQLSFEELERCLADWVKLEAVMRQSSCEP